MMRTGERFFLFLLYTLIRYLPVTEVPCNVDVFDELLKGTERVERRRD